MRLLLSWALNITRGSTADLLHFFPCGPYRRPFQFPASLPPFFTASSRTSLPPSFLLFIAFFPGLLALVRYRSSCFLTFLHTGFGRPFHFFRHDLAIHHLSSLSPSLLAPTACFLLATFSHQKCSVIMIQCMYFRPKAV